MNETNSITQLCTEVSENRESDTLSHIHKVHREEIANHRDTMLRSVQWCTSVYLAIAGGLIALGSSSWHKLGNTGVFFGLAVVILLGIFVVSQLLHSASAINSNAKIVVKTATAMGIFDTGKALNGQSIYPEAWKMWGQSKHAGYYHWFYIGMVVLLAISLIIFMCLL